MAYTATASIWRGFEDAAREARMEARQPAPGSVERADDRLERARCHSRYNIAIHEAAHAIVASVCAEREILEATIVPAPQATGIVHGGNVRYAPGDSDDPARDAYYDITIGLAGTIAEGRVVPQADVEAAASSDIELITRIAADHHIDLDIVRAVKFTRQMVDRLWPAIEEVAADLIERGTIGDAEVKQAIARAKARKQ